MSLRIDTTELISGAYVIGETGLGVLGSAVPSTGTHGAGYLYNDLSLPADAGKEVMGRIITPPASGTFFAFEDSSFILTGAADGTHTFTYQLTLDGVDSTTDIGYGPGVGLGTIIIGATSVTLVIQDASHAHSTDAIALTTQAVLAIADALHAHAADNITLTPSGSTSLTVADATHAHTADNLVLTSAHALVIADAAHAHTADNLTLTASGAPTLTVADALHAHSADNIVLTSSRLLAIADATHAHYADNLTLYLPGTAQPAGARVGPRMATSGRRPANVQTSARAARR